MNPDLRRRLARTALVLSLAIAWDAQFHMAHDAGPASTAIVRWGLAFIGSRPAWLLVAPAWAAIAWSGNVWGYGAAAACATIASWTLAGSDASHIEHSVVMPQCLTLFLFGALLSRRRAKDAEAQAWELACALLGAIYFITGLVKLLNTGWSWSTGETVRALVASETVHSSGKLRALRLAFASRPALGRAASDYALTVELIGGPAFVFRRLRPYAGAAIVAMHSGIFLLTGIPWALFPIVVATLSLPEKRAARGAKGGGA